MGHGGGGSPAQAVRARKALGKASHFGRVGAGGARQTGGLESAVRGEWWRGQTGLAALREQHEQSAEVRPPGEKPAEVFLAEPSQG